MIGIDRRAFEGSPRTSSHHQIDIRRKKTQDIFRQQRIAAVVHLGVMHDPRASEDEHHSWNVVGFQKLLEYVAQYDVPKLVVLSSANVYGPRPDNPQFLSEDAPLLGGAAFSEIRDLIEVDMLAQSFFWKRPETETVILRPVHILGAVRNAPSNYLRLTVDPDALGFDPMVQVIHQDDVVSAIVRALRARDRAASSTSPARRRCRSRGSSRRPGGTRIAMPHSARQAPRHAALALPRHLVPRARARSHPLRVHGRRRARARESSAIARATTSTRPSPR